MKSPTTYNRHRGFSPSKVWRAWAPASTRRTRLSSGFTLIEMLVVLSLIAIVASFTAVVTLDSYRGFAFRTDRDLLVSALQRARSQSMNNVCLGTACSNGKPHGVAVTANDFVVFQGTSYALRDSTLDESIPRGGAGVSLTGGSMNEVVFTQLSGIVQAPGTMSLLDTSGRSSTISINTEGSIFWTN